MDINGEQEAKLLAATALAHPPFIMLALMPDNVPRGRLVLRAELRAAQAVTRLVAHLALPAHLAQATVAHLVLADTVLLALAARP